MSKPKKYGELKKRKDPDPEEIRKDIVSLAFQDPNFPLHYYNYNSSVMEPIVNQKLIGQFPYSPIMATKEMK